MSWVPFFSVLTLGWATLSCCTLGYSLVSHQTSRVSVWLENGMMLRVGCRESFWVLVKDRSRFASCSSSCSLETIRQPPRLSEFHFPYSKNKNHLIHLIGFLRVLNYIKMISYINNVRYIVNFHSLHQIPQWKSLTKDPLRIS